VRLRHEDRAALQRLALPPARNRRLPVRALPGATGGNSMVVVLPAGREVAAQQVQHRATLACFGGARLPAQRRVVGGHRLVEAPEFMQGESTIAERLGVTGPRRDRGIELDE